MNKIILSDEDSEKYVAIKKEILNMHDYKKLLIKLQEELISNLEKDEQKDDFTEEDGQAYIDEYEKIKYDYQTADMRQKYYYSLFIKLISKQNLSVAQRFKLERLICKDINNVPKKYQFK